MELVKLSGRSGLAAIAVCRDVSAGFAGWWNGGTSYRYRTRRSDERFARSLVELARRKPRFGYRRCMFYWAAPERCEPQAGASGVSRRGMDDSAERSEALRARGQASAGADFANQDGLGISCTNAVESDVQSGC